MMTWRYPCSVLVGSCVLLAMLMLSGCGGCRSDPTAERDEELKKKLEEQEEPKEEIEIAPLKTVPADTEFAFPFVKPGHWLTVRHEITANFYDFQGELRTGSTDMEGTPYHVAGTPYQLRLSRPAPLAKTQPKLIETTYFVPRLATYRGKAVWLNRELRSSRGGRLIKQDPYKVATMPAYQYFFVVLAREPEQYGYLKHLTAIKSPAPKVSESDTLLYYRVSLNEVDTTVALPSNPLTWTSIAFVLWDDIDPSVFTVEQQEAMQDWLQWGGQLIVSGPNSLDKLRGSFLEQWLPATPGKSVEAAAGAIDDVNSHWALVDTKSGEKLTLPVLPGRSLVTVELEKHSQAEYLPGCGQLVLERRVGGGRIVVTAFSLTDQTLVAWECFDSFFNACLLRRPPREFGATDFVATGQWAGYHPFLAQDARLTTTLRYFTRDIGHFSSGSAGLSHLPEPKELEFDPSLAEPSDDKLPDRVRNPEDDPFHFNGYAPLSYGVAAWNDRSGASDAARRSLKDAAGISIPRGRFVLQVLAAYLIILAPLNWLLFRLIGRVEWAWVAAPVIALVAAVAVVRLAQLDIGFASSITEVAVAEVQGGYPRAHITRYTALYTSLTNTYDLLFDDDNSLAQPFAKATDYVRKPHDATHLVTLRRDRELTLQDFLVPSNTTEIVHCEQMYDMGGSFDLVGDDSTGFLIKNSTDFSLQGVGVLRCSVPGRLEAAWIGDMEQGATVSVNFEQAIGGIPYLTEWDESVATQSDDRQARDMLKQADRNNDAEIDRREARRHDELASDFDRFDADRDGKWQHRELIAWCRQSRAGEVSLGQLFELASQGLKLSVGDMRMIGWTDAEMPGLTIHPAVAQTNRRTMFIVHLQRAKLPPARPDLNRKADVVDEEAEEEASEEGETAESMDGTVEVSTDSD
jgi:hypothetical protein